MSETFNNIIDIKDRLNVEQIELLLNKHYGKGKHSLVVGKEDDVIFNDKPIYYYDRNIEKDILDMVTILNDGYSKIGTKTFITFDIDLIKKYKDKSIIPQCACLKKTCGNWTIEINRINRVRFHRTYNKKIIASIVLSDSICDLNDTDYNTMYGYWGRPKYYRFYARRQETEGISYFFNKNMIYNKAFRNFSFDFFNLVANIEKKYILKDVARSIKNCGFMLVPISYPVLLEMHTPSELINCFNVDNNITSINYNKIDINIGYIITKVSRYIDKDDIRMLYSIDTSKLFDMIDLPSIYDGMSRIESIKNFFIKYYINYYNCYDDDNKIGILKDYVDMSMDSNVVLKLGCSYRRIVKLHDELAIRQRIKNYGNGERIQLVPCNSKYNILEKELLNLDKGVFKRIHNTFELYNEGVAQHNCVFTRKKGIFHDDISIFHWDYLDNNFTIQFRCDYDGKYCIDEIRGKYNAECPCVIVNELNEEISKINNNYQNELRRYGWNYNENEDEEDNNIFL